MPGASHQVSRSLPCGDGRDRGTAARSGWRETMSCRADTARPTTADEATPLLELVCAVFLVRIDRRGRSRCSWRALLTGTAGAATARRSPRSRRYAVSPTGCTRTREGSCAADSHSPARAYPRAPPPEALGCMGTPTRLFRTPARLHKTPHSAARDPQSAALRRESAAPGGSRLQRASVGCTRFKPAACRAHTRRTRWGSARGEVAVRVRPALRKCSRTLGLTVPRQCRRRASKKRMLLLPFRSGKPPLFPVVESTIARSKMCFP